jgi:uncharacterized RDD family membrane protein YckC
MKKCPYCGKEVEETYSFCMYCGNKLFDTTNENNADGSFPPILKESINSFQSNAVKNNLDKTITNEIRQRMEMNYASFWIRFSAFLIDYIISILLALLVLVISGLYGYINAISFYPDPGIAAGLAARQISPLIPVVIILYFSFSESSKFKATIGKRIFKIKVVDFTGDRIGFWKAFQRNVCKFIISYPFFFFGFFFAIWTKKKQTLHDLLANTVVIKA